MKAYRIGLYEKAMPHDLTWKEKLSAAKEAGYDFVEMSIDKTEEKISRINMSKEERLNLISCMYEVGIPIRSMCVSALTEYSIGNPDEAIRARGMEILAGSIRLADDLGIRIVMIPGYDIYYGESSRESQLLFEQNIKIAAQWAAEYGVLVGFETMENDFMNTVWKAMYYVNEVESPYLQIYPDAGNLKNAAVQYQKDEIGDLRRGKGHITALHLKETLPGIYREVPFGAGHVNFEEVLKAAWELGIRRYVTEFWYKGNPAWQQDLVDANRRMSAILDGLESA